MPHDNVGYEFENYRLDITQRVLTREGQAISLTPKATDVLLILLQKAGQLVERDSLISQVWPDAFVEEANLTQNIFLLRRTLQRDGPGPKFIETVTRRGYRFVAPVRKVYAKTDHEDLLDPPRRTRQIPILAVLPFANATGNIDLQYLAEGIPETIINSFSGLSQIRVISRSTTFRYKNREFDPQTVGQKLGADVLLIGKISLRDSVVRVGVELVGVDNGWQLWGQTFDVDSENIFEIQDQITQQISCALELPLSREDEKRVAKRYTENAAAYQAYLEGRYHWSRYTREGIEKAIGHFGRAIDLDPNYALAYAGIVDCYLRLATNYLPPEDDFPAVDDGEFEQEKEDKRTIDCDTPTSTAHGPAAKLRTAEMAELTHEKVKLRHEWDWKGAERELRRANELKTDYPAAHQWHAAYKFAKGLFNQSVYVSSADAMHGAGVPSPESAVRLGKPMASSRLTASERVQVFCTVAREQIAVGNYEAAEQVLAPWLGQNRSELTYLSETSAADLLFTIGMLVGYVSSTGSSGRGQRRAEALLNGAIALFNHLGLYVRTAETRIELARCYYREGLYDLARAELMDAVDVLIPDQEELRCLCLVLMGAVNRDAGKLRESLENLSAASEIDITGQLVTGRCQHELGTTLKELAQAECDESYATKAVVCFQQAVNDSEAIGNHRLSAASDNNLGYLLMTLGRVSDAQRHLLRARSRFERFHDAVRRAQVNETLARLYSATERYDEALDCILHAVSVLERTEEEALVAEALSTKAVVLARTKRFKEAKRTFAEAQKVAERSFHSEGSASILLLMLEEICEELDDDERLYAMTHLGKLITSTPQTSLLNRFTNVVNHLGEVHGMKFQLM